MFNRLNFCILGSIFLLCGCVSNMPIKNVHENPPTENAETPAVVTPPAATVPPAAEPQTPAAQQEEPLTDLELQKYAYELGLDPRQGIADADRKRIHNRKKLRQLERALDSQKERLQYSKVLPWLNGDQEKIDMLSIPSIEGRQVWINKNKIWSRAKDLSEFDDVVESQDIAIGMPSEYVKRSWGDPDRVETSGNPIYKNERWQYLRQVPTPQGYKQERRSVYFEGGRVVGWETE